MREKDSVLENVRPIGVKVKSIRKTNSLEDVYCLASETNGSMIANGIVTKQCDALRYALATHKVSSFNEDDYYRKQEQESRSKLHPGGYGFR